MSIVIFSVKGRLIGVINYTTVNGFCADTLDRVRKTGDRSGAVTSETTFRPYGEAGASSGSNSSHWRLDETIGDGKDGAPSMYVKARNYFGE